MGKRYTTSVSFGTNQPPNRPEPPRADTPHEFERFETLTRKLSAVPKPELGKKRAT